VKDFGADVNQADHDGSIALFIAAQHGHLNVLRCLAKEYGADMNIVEENGATPLSIAAQNGHLDIVRCLAGELRADVNQAEHDGWTALSVAAYHGNRDVVRCLAEDFCADVNQADQDGTTPLSIAADAGNLDMVQYLIVELGADNDGRTPLMVAAHANNQPLLKHLIHKGALVRAVSVSGETAIMMLAAARATAAQIAYLKVRDSCANPGCDGGGRMRCCVCKAMRYCGMACRVAHWRVHRGCCRPPTDAESEGSEVVSCVFSFSTFQLRESWRKRCAICKETRYCGKECQVSHWRKEKTRE
jgi:hypothetical protein